MKLYDVFRLISGCVELRADGGFPERFINVCTAEGIKLWDIRKLGDSVCAKTTVDGYRAIRGAAKKSGMRVRLTAKHGLPFFIFRHRFRGGLLIGAALFFILLAALSGRVWIIEVSGNSAVSDTEILECFETAGLKTGRKISDLNTVEIRSSAVMSLKGISRAAINISGCTAVIEVREGQISPEIEKSGGPSNIVAAKDGQVQIIEPYRGTAAVKSGQTVTTGDLLISGVTQSRTDSNIFSEADGYIVATTSIKTEAKIPISTQELIPKRSRRYSLYFLGMEFPPQKNQESCEYYLCKKYMTAGGKKLPFGIFYRDYFRLKEKKLKLSADEARLAALSDYALRFHRDTLHAQLISDKTDVVTGRDSVSVIGESLCYENIGRASALEIEETPESSESGD
ncbi:MAG: sporulation protein YqfD [Clostridia bacterium]|nr:sporulation protein YqfD [Clostridia bacterium]